MEDVSVLLLKYFPVYYSSNAINFSKLLDNCNPEKEYRLLRLVNFFFTRQGTFIDLDAESIISAIESYLKFIVSDSLKNIDFPQMAHEASSSTSLNNYSSKYLTLLAKSILQKNTKQALDLLSQSNLNTSLVEEISREDVDFHSLFAHIVSTSGQSLVYPMSFSDFLSAVFSNSSAVDRSYTICLNFSDICVILLEKHRETFNKQEKNDADLYQLVTSIVTLFNTGDIYSVVLLYLLRITYILKHAGKTPMDLIYKKLPSPINRLLTDELLFASENSYEIAFGYFVVTMQFRHLSTLLASTQDLTLYLASNSSLSPKVALCLLLYEYLEKNGLSNGHELFISSFPLKLLSINMQAQLDLLLDPENVDFTTLMELFSPAIGAALKLISNEKIIKEISRYLSISLAEFYYSKHIDSFNHELSRLPFELSSGFISEFNRSFLCSFLIASSLHQKDKEYKPIQYFLFYVASVLNPPTGSLFLLSPILSLLRNIIEMTGGLKAVPQILFFFHMFSLYFHQFVKTNNASHAKSLCLLQYLHIPAPSTIRSCEKFDDYILKMKQDIKRVIRDFMLSSMEPPFDQVPSDILNKWIPHLLKHDLKHPITFDVRSNQNFDPSINRLVDRIPSEDDYKYYLLNC